MGVDMDASTFSESLHMIEYSGLIDVQQMRLVAPVPAGGAVVPGQYAAADLLRDARVPVLSREVHQDGPQEPRNGPSTRSPGHNAGEQLNL